MARLTRSGLLIGLAAAGLAGSASAQTGIGSATTVEREVSGILSGRTRAVGTGDSVFSNETIRTANESAARLRFLDDTNIAIGPSASVTLDRFVYNPDGNARSAAVRVGQGAMRWVSGASDSRAYSIRTPHVVIGVRGTSFDLLVERSQTTVTLNQGVITVCAVAAPRNCVTLNAPGQTVTATSRRIDGVRPIGPAPTDFADRCLRPIDRQACTMTARADVIEPRLAQPAMDAPLWNGFYFGVHGGGGRQSSTVTVAGTPSVEESIGFRNVARSLDVSGGGDVGVWGAQAGYNLQVGQFVLGVETDIAYTRLGGRSQYVATIPFFGINPTTTAEQKLTFLGTARGRAGVAFYRFMIFGTAGFSYGGVETTGSIIPVPIGRPTGVYPTYINHRSQTRFGWALGGGVEYRLFANVSLKADYLHYDLGRQSIVLPEVTGVAAGEFATMSARAKGDVVRVGVNYQF
ncbi:MAG: outer membrane beta-barrel protein [Rhizobiales bacterium]|nr:outer membrane beta-barrel protein [Hyphomicrobiales bacterium]